MTPAELERFVQAMRLVRDELAIQDRDLSPRDLHMLQAGMRAIFLIESRAHGDDARAAKHTIALTKLLQAGAPVNATIAQQKASNDR